MKIPSKEEEEEDAFSPTGTTYSSSLRRSSPRTISFRVSVPAQGTRLCHRGSPGATAVEVELQGGGLGRWQVAVDTQERPHLAVQSGTAGREWRPPQGPWAVGGQTGQQRVVAGPPPNTYRGPRRDFPQNGWWRQVSPRQGGEGRGGLVGS